MQQCKLSGFELSGLPAAQGPDSKTTRPAPRGSGPCRS